MNGRIFKRDAWARKSHWFVAALGAVLAVQLTPSLANAASCKSEDWKEFNPLQGCPAEFSCLQITLQAGEVDDSNLSRRTVNLPRDCSYKGVRFKITRSNTILDCQGETLEQSTGASYQKDIAVLVHGIQSFRQYPDPNLSCEQQGASNDCEDPGAYACRFPVPESCSLTRTPLHDVTVRQCKIRNYNVGARVQMSSPKASKDLIESTYVKWFHHENERTCRVERIENCMRAGAPRNIRFEDVDIRNSGNVGFYVFPYIHDTVFAGGVVKDTDKGPGIYLTHGSRNNSIEDSSIKDAYREGIAMDGSAYNRIIRNTIQNNSRHWWEGLPIQRAKKYGAGITLFKNAWEKRRSYADKQRSDPWKDRSPPRTQHAMGNSIEWNKFRDQRYGVWIGYRQNIEWETSERGDPIYYGGSKEAYFHKYSENTKVIYNTFEKVRVGVRVWDDSATIIGNKFLKPIYTYVNNQKVPMSTAIKVGHDIRRKVSDPVRNTTVAHNNFSPGFANFIRETDCTFDNEIINNFIKKSDGSFTAVGSTKGSCTAPRAALNGHFPGASGAYSLATVSHDLSLFEKDKRWFGGDVNSDGVGDLLNIYKASDGRWRVWIHVGMGRAFGHRSSLQRLDVKKNGEWLVANFDGEGGDDLVFIFEENGSLFANTWLDDGIGFSPSGPTSVGGMSPLGHKPPGMSRWLAGDFDGDGKADLAQVIDEQGDARVLTHRSVGGQFFQASYSSQVLGAFVESHRWLSGDFDGDGTHDLVLVFKNSAGKAIALVRLGTGSGFENFSWLQYISTNGSASGAAGFWDSQRWLVTNFDGDSRDDLVLVYNSDRRNRVWRSRSTGSTFAHGGIQTLGLYYDDKVWLSSPASSGRDGLLVIGTQRTRRPGGGGIDVLPQLPTEVGPLAPVDEPEEKPTPDVRPTATTTPPATLAPENTSGPRFLDRSIGEIRDSQMGLITRLPG